MELRGVRIILHLTTGGKESYLASLANVLLLSFELKFIIKYKNANNNF